MTSLERIERLGVNVMKDKILEKLKKVDSLPFLFIGSGLSRRYLDMDNWEGLLKRFSFITSGKEYGYNSYYEQARPQNNPYGIMPKIASLIENDFNMKWFDEDSYSESRNLNSINIQNHVSPLKIEIAAHMITNSIVKKNQFTPEVSLLEQLGSKSIAGIITTNYDTFLDDLFPKFTKYIGQEDLIFSPIHGISEIYKIHGCASKPESIIINEADYSTFDDRKAYLAAKLLTIFIEHPIIFIGYSIEDYNIVTILKSIIKCLSTSNLNKLKERLIFIEYCEKGHEEITNSSKTFEGIGSVEMLRIKLNDYGILYSALLENKSKYNVSILRQLKENIYELVLTNKPSEKIRVVGLEDDDNLDKLEVVIGVGILGDFGERGYTGVTCDDLFRDIVLDDGEFDNENILNRTLPSLIPRFRNSHPFYKYLDSVSSENWPSWVEKEIKTTFDEFLNNTIKKFRENNCDRNCKVSDLTSKYTDPIKIIRTIPNLKEENIDVAELHDFLIKIYENPGSCVFTNSSIKSDLRRVVKIFDWLKYYKSKEPR